MQQSVCPTCGHQVAPLELLVCLQSNVAARLGRFARLTKDQAIVLHMLRDAYPGAVSVNKLRAGLYGAGQGPEDETGVIRAHMCNLRRRLAPLHIRIGTAQNTGYRLTLDALPACRAVA